MLYSLCPLPKPKYREQKYYTTEPGVELWEFTWEGSTCLGTPA